MSTLLNTYPPQPLQSPDDSIDSNIGTFNYHHRAHMSTVPHGAVPLMSTVPERAVKQYTSEEWAPHDHDIVYRFQCRWTYREIAQWLIDKHDFPATAAQISLRLLQLRAPAPEEFSIKSSSNGIESPTIINSFPPSQEINVTLHASPNITIPLDGSIVLDFPIPLHGRIILDASLLTPNFDPLNGSNTAGATSQQGVVHNPVYTVAPAAVAGSTWAPNEIGQPDQAFHWDHFNPDCKGCQSTALLWQTAEAGQSGLAHEAFNSPQDH